MYDPHQKKTDRHSQNIRILTRAQAHVERDFIQHKVFSTKYFQIFFMSFI